MLEIDRNKIIRLLAEKRLTQTFLARRMGVSRQFVGQILNTIVVHNYSLGLVSRIAAALDVPAISLIKNTKKEELKNVRRKN